MTRGVGVAEFLTGVIPAWALPIVLVATTLAEAPVLVSLVVARFWFRDRRAGLRLVAIGTVALAVVLAAKHVLALPRPPASLRVPIADVAPPFDAIYRELLDTDESGFPSGHATLAAAVYGGAALDADSKDRPRWLAIAGAFALVVGLSRVALGVHYLVDVLAGIVLGAGIVLALRAADERWGAPRGALALGGFAIALALAVSPGSTNVVAAAGGYAGATACWLVLDVPSTPWSSLRSAGVRVLAALVIAAAGALAALALAPNVPAWATPVLVFAVAAIGSGAAVAVTAFNVGVEPATTGGSES